MRATFTNAAAAVFVLAACAALQSCESAQEARGATSLLGLAQPVSPTEAAEMALDEYNPDARARGTVLLANAYFGDQEPYLELYVDHIDDPDPAVRAAAARALSIHGSPEHVPLLIQRLDPATEPSEAVRLEAARALQRIHNTQAVPTLLAAIRRPIPTDPEAGGEPNPDVRAEAAIALGQYAEPRVFEGLVVALEERHLAVNTAARDALRTITGQDFGFDRRAWARWYETVTDPFAGRGEYRYPVFQRDRRIHEVLLPFLPEPPNEPSAPPVGMPPAPG